MQMQNDSKRPTKLKICKGGKELYDKYLKRRENEKFFDA